MKMHKSKWAGMVAAGLLAFAAQGALAQPGGGHHGPGFGGPGGGFALEQILASLKASLSLNTSQQAMWDNVVAQGKAARQTGHANMAKVREALDAELARPEPDFAAVATVADAARTSNEGLHKQVRDQWLALYATFTPAQKTIVRDAVKARVSKMEAMRQRFMDRAHPAAPAN